MLYSEHGYTSLDSIISHLSCSLVLVVIDVTATNTATITSSVNDDRKLISFFHFCIPFTCCSRSLRSYSCSVFFSSCRNSNPRILATTEDSLGFRRILAMTIVYVRIIISNTVVIIIIIIVIIVITIIIQEFSASLLSVRTLKFPTHPTAFLPVITVWARELWSLYIGRTKNNSPKDWEAPVREILAIIMQLCPCSSGVCRLFTPLLCWVIRSRRIDVVKSV